MAAKGELSRAEDRAWAELMGVIASLTSQEIEEPGYTPDGWSVKDLMAHIAAWQAEAEMALQQIRNGTYRSQKLDVDSMNQRFYEANRDQPLSVVRAELASSRNRMLAEFDDLPEVTPEGEEWFVESGSRHYEEHLERLRGWAEELRSRR